MLHLVPADDPILRRRCCRDDFVISSNKINQMFFLMREKNALGLAASQVGFDARLFVTAWGEVFVNPRIVEAHERIRTREGCLSLPNTEAQVHRWKTIRLADGRAYKSEQAVVIQHEIDHLNGTLITDLTLRPA